MTINRTSTGLWALRILAALIMLQTLYFKFTGAEESIYIFSKIGMEPWGRIGSGVMELIASILILIPATTAVGAMLGVGLMSGALFFHITKLGYEVQGDGGQLFIYALLVFFSCAVLVIAYRRDLIRTVHLVINRK
jgi:uncharacterized membrane protein YphA (DoxX/SURF4 family)